MKNLVKILFTVLFIGAISIQINAQTASGEINVSATVTTELTWTGERPVTFGAVPKGYIPVVDNLVGSHQYAAAPLAGLANLTGTGTLVFNVTFPTVLNLITGAGGANQVIDFNVTVSQAQGIDDGTTGGLEHTSGSAITFNAAGEHTFWIGGTLSETGQPLNVIPTAVENGAYSADMQLTVEYN